MINGISIVICTYNGVSRLEPTLQSVLNQEAQCAFELIVVDNASTDNTSSFCLSLLQKGNPSFAWKVVVEKQAGLNNARLLGLRQAKYDFVLFCDDDNHLDKNYIQIGFDILNEHASIGALGGCGTPLFESERPTWFDSYGHSFAVGPQADQNGKLDEFPAELYGAGSFYRLQPLLDFFDKGFHSIMSDRKGKTLASGGDVEWCYLLQLAGYDIWYDGRLSFLHSMPASRMQWEYYIRLKQGIAGGASRLLPYLSLLRDKKTGVTKYLLQHINCTARATAIYFKQKLSSTFKATKPEDKLAHAILQAKMHSFWSNGSTALRHFIQLKSLV